MSDLFRFASVHRLDAPVGTVFEVLRDAESWGQWWPQIKRVTPRDDRTGTVVIRSLLPITLVLEVTSELTDPALGVLRARLDGDLHGWAQFTVTGESGGSTLEYEQETTLVHPHLPSLAAHAMRPLLVVNHAAMMHAGMRGLQARAASR